MTETENKGEATPEPEIKTSADFDRARAKAFAEKIAEGFRGPSPDPDGDLEPAPAKKAAPADPAPVAEGSEAAPAEPDTEGMDALVDRLAGGDAKSPRDAMREQLIARGMPEWQARVLVSHAKRQDVEGLLKSAPPVQGGQDTAGQPSAPPSPTPPANEPAAESRTSADLLTGLRANLEEIGALDESGARDLAELNARLARVDELEKAVQAVAQQQQDGVHHAHREQARQALSEARSGLADQFPAVLDNATFQTQVAPVLEALVTSDATRDRPLAENLEVACRAVLQAGSAEDARSRKLQLETAGRQTPVAPTARNGQRSTISELDLAKSLVSQKLTGRSGSDMKEWAGRWAGRIK